MADLRSQQIKDRFQSLLTTSEVGADPTTGTLQNGKGTAFTALTVAGVPLGAGGLDDYEPGTFTPSFTPETGSFTSITYGERVGAYIKVGKLVFFTLTVATSALNVTGASGAIFISGLPFVVKAGVSTFVSVSLARWGTFFSIPRCATLAGSSNINITINASNADPASAQVTDMNTTTTFNRNLTSISGCYQTA